MQTRWRKKEKNSKRNIFLFTKRESIERKTQVCVFWVVRLNTNRSFTLYSKLWNRNTRRHRKNDRENAQRTHEWERERRREKEPATKPYGTYVLCLLEDEIQMLTDRHVLTHTFNVSVCVRRLSMYALQNAQQHIRSTERWNELARSLWFAKTRIAATWLYIRCAAVLTVEVVRLLHYSKHLL